MVSSTSAILLTAICDSAEYFNPSNYYTYPTWHVPQNLQRVLENTVNMFIQITSVKNEFYFQLTVYFWEILENVI